jgi:hypothetical protein
MTSSIKYVGMDVHKESISLAVRNAAGKIVMECVIETKANTILQFFDGLRGEVNDTVPPLPGSVICVSWFSKSQV